MPGVARVSSVRAAPKGRRSGSAALWAASVAVVAGAAAAILALYLAHPLLQGYRLPVGPDGPVYTWWTRFAGSFGLEGVAPGRPGVPAAALVVGAILGTEPVETIAVLGPVLAVACGLAGAALVATTVSPRPLPVAAAAILTGAFAAYLAGGWLANLAQAALLVGALAALSVAQDSWRPVWAGAALLAAAGLAHGLFLAVGLAILAGVVLAHLPESRRQRRAGAPVWDTAAARIAVAAAGGSVVGWVGLAAVHGAGAVPGDTSQDGFFRRVGLRGLLLDRYRERFIGDAARAAIPVTLGAILGAVGLRSLLDRRGGPPGQAARIRYLTAVVAAWAAVSVVGIVALALTGLGPPNRVLVFSFFLPLGAAAGVAALWGRGRLAAAVAALAVAAFAGTSMVGWYRQSPSLHEHELVATHRAGGVVEALPPGTPVIVLVDTSEPAAAFHVTRMANVIRMGMPPGGLPHVRVAVGRPRDVLAGRPTLTGDREHDLIARDTVARTAPVRDRAAVLVMEPFHPAFGEIAGRTVAPGIKAVRGASELDDASRAPAPPPLTGPGQLVLRSVALVTLLGVAGGGWARWALSGTHRSAVVALAPVAGLAVAVLGGVLVDAAGATAGPPWGPVAAMGLAAAGYAAAALAPRR